MTISGLPLTPQEYAAFEEALEVYKDYLARGQRDILMFKVHFDKDVVGKLLSASLGQFQGWLSEGEHERAAGALLLLLSAIFSCGAKAGQLRGTGGNGHGEKEGL